MHKLNSRRYTAATETLANQAAIELETELDCADDSLEVLVAFHQEMADQKQDSYQILEIEGVAALRETFVWWFDDGSILFVGWSDEETIAMGVFAAGTVFQPTALHDGKIQTLH